MIYGSVCSGIEAASVAWKPLGWRPSFFSEIEKFPRAVLAHHYPEVPCHGDFTTIKGDEYPAIDLLVGGTPCQSFSIAGRRLGLDDPRGNLALEYLALARRMRARWIVWENVPGVLSSYSGSEQAGREVSEGPAGGEGTGIEDRDFAMFLSFVRECGYGFAYRVLDAQYVRVDGFARAVPQRRRRVFLVGYIGDWRRAAAVLFEPEGMSWHPAPRREAREGVAPTISARPTGGGGLGTDFDLDGGLICANSGDTGYCLTASAQQSLDAETETLLAVAHSLRGEGFDASEDGTGRGIPLVPFVAGAICRDSFSGGAGGRPEGAAAGHFVQTAFDCKGSQVQVDTTGTAPTLRAMGYADSHQNGGGQLAIATAWSVRRLTPMECERLQGFPDGWTQVPVRGKPAADGPRYKALGNSMAVNVMRWIGERIELVENLDLGGKL